MINDIILMEEESFQLIKWAPRNRNVYFPLQSFIRHKCQGGGFCWWDPRGLDGVCDCGGYPPESMMGVWKLHNFDWIQSKEIIEKTTK